MPNYLNSYQPIYQQNPQVYPQMQPQPQIQNGGFVPVRGEQEARNYPVAPGNSVTFKDETAPYVYTKTMGFSQLDRPSFEKFKLVKEDIIDTSEQVSEDNKDIERIKSDIKKIWGEINELKSHKKQTRKEDGDD